MHHHMLLGNTLDVKKLDILNAIWKMKKILVPAMKGYGLYRDTEIYLKRLRLNTESLILTTNYNLAENYNPIVCKFIGVKRVNYSRRGYHQLKCEVAAISFNTCPEYFRSIYKAKPDSKQYNILRDHVINR